GHVPPIVRAVLGGLRFVDHVCGVGPGGFVSMAIVEIDIEHASHAITTKVRSLPAVRKHAELLPAMTVRIAHASDWPAATGRVARAHDPDLRRYAIGIRHHGEGSWRRDLRRTHEVFDVRARRELAVWNDLREFVSTS